MFIEEEKDEDELIYSSAWDDDEFEEKEDEEYDDEYDEDWDEDEENVPEFSDEEMEEFENSLVDYIPNNPINLFPAARKIHRHFVLHVGPTNSGKTHDALEALANAEAGVYLGPLRLLAFEAYERLNDLGTPCDLVTGEEEIYVKGAHHMAGTIEMLKINQHYDVAVIDEAQMLSDPDRGWAWTNAILGVCAEEVHVCLAPNAETIVKKLIDLCGDNCEVIRHERQTPLIADEERFHFPDDVREHDALVLFSKRDVMEYADYLESIGIPCSRIYGALPYEVRQNEVSRFVNGETKVVVATDAIGMGMNLPIERIVFMSSCKFDGYEERTLRPEEIQQIAGRAGRKGMYEEGHYCFRFDAEEMLSLSKRDPGEITSVYLDMPSSLLGMGGLLSDTMKKWQKTELSSTIIRKKWMNVGFCEQLEEISKYPVRDKQLIYTFVKMPFDERNFEISQTVIDMFRHELRGEHMEWEEPLYFDTITSRESVCKKCDLWYNYLRRFTDGSQLNAVKEFKDRVSKELAEDLSKSKVKEKKCKKCGKILPWYALGKLCDNCRASKSAFA